MYGVMIGEFNGLRRKHRIVQLCVRKDKSRAAIGWGCIGKSSVGFGKLGEVIAW